MNFTIPKKPCCKGTIHNPFFFVVKFNYKTPNFVYKGEKEINACGRCCKDADFSNEQGLRCLQFSIWTKEKAKKNVTKLDILSIFKHFTTIIS